jgi:hypothetical protein
MTIIVAIKPQVQAELTRRAAALGWAIESYAASLLEEAVHLPSGGNPQAVAKERAKAAAERVRELRRGGHAGGWLSGS